VGTVDCDKLYSLAGTLVLSSFSDFCMVAYFILSVMPFLLLSFCELTLGAIAVSINLYPTKDPYAGHLNSSAYPTKYPYPGLCALQCCSVSFSETHCTIRATFVYIAVW
jgi:hypothetical protein